MSSLTVLPSVIFEDDDILTGAKISAVGCTECTQKSKHRGQKSLGSAQRETQKAGTDLSFIGLYLSTFRCVGSILYCSG